MVVPGGLLESELGAPERCAEFGDQFLGAVGGITESAGQISGESGLVTGPVDVLVCGGRVERRRGRRTVSGPAGGSHRVRGRSTHDRRRSRSSGADAGEVELDLCDPSVIVDRARVRA